MIYILGIITGIVLSLIVFVVALYQKPNIERSTNQLLSKLKKKGEIIEPESEDLQEWINNLKQE